MQAFWTAFTQLFTMITVLFSAGEKVAKTIDNVAAVGELKSDTYRKEAKNDQEIAIDEFAFAREKRKAELAEKRKALGTTAPAATNP